MGHRIIGSCRNIAREQEQRYKHKLDFLLKTETSLFASEDRSTAGNEHKRKKKNRQS